MQQIYYFFKKGVIINLTIFGLICLANSPLLYILPIYNLLYVLLLQAVLNSCNIYYHSENEKGNVKIPPTIFLYLLQGSLSLIKVISTSLFFKAIINIARFLSSFITHYCYSKIDILF